ncbi:hypothetical protein FB451DRAFT_1476340 [Mycena latifolia]|nr:hypothetical protein FB451DRAFT_1476340 [Mycena latifolia]
MLRNEIAPWSLCLKINARVAREPSEQHQLDMVEPPEATSALKALMKGQLTSGKPALTASKWPSCFYADREYDPKNPEKGLSQSVLVTCPPTHMDGADKLKKTCHPREHVQYFVKGRIVGYACGQLFKDDPTDPWVVETLQWFQKYVPSSPSPTKCTGTETILPEVSLVVDIILIPPACTVYSSFLFIVPLIQSASCRTNRFFPSTLVVLFLAMVQGRIYCPEAGARRAACPRGTILADGGVPIVADLGRPESRLKQVAWSSLLKTDQPQHGLADGLAGVGTLVGLHICLSGSGRPVPTGGGGGGGGGGLNAVIGGKTISAAPWIFSERDEHTTPWSLLPTLKKRGRCTEFMVFLRGEERTERWRNGFNGMSGDRFVRAKASERESMSTGCIRFIPAHLLLIALRLPSVEGRCGVFRGLTSPLGRLRASQLVEYGFVVLQGDGTYALSFGLHFTTFMFQAFLLHEGPTATAKLDYRTTRTQVMS